MKTQMEKKGKRKEEIERGKRKEER